MEIKDGRITPTSQSEAEVFSHLLREQQLANQREPADATKAQPGHQLSGWDSYKLFCTAERRINNGLAGPEEARIIGGVILGLAAEFVDQLDLDSLREHPERFFEKVDEVEAGRLSSVVSLANRALTDRYAED